MDTLIKNHDEIEKMKVAGKLAADVLIMIEPHVKAGITTKELDSICHDYIVNVQHAIPAPLNYHGFPNSICASVNHAVCHGIPNNRALKCGDIVNLDITVIKDGYHGDTSKMFVIGQVSTLTELLLKITQESLYLAINAVRPGTRLGDIGAIIQSHAEQHHFSVVREYCGHGIGRVFHEPPQVLHFGTPNTGITLEPGMIFTIEPMLNIGKRHTKLLDDGWTVVTKDRSLSAQYEHTILVTNQGRQVLTQRPEEII